MKQALPSSYAALFDPAVALAVAKRAAQWDLPRHICHPLDRYHAQCISSDLAAFDAAVDLAPGSDDEISGESQNALNSGGDSTEENFDGEDDR